MNGNGRPWTLHSHTSARGSKALPSGRGRKFVRRLCRSERKQNEAIDNEHGRAAHDERNHGRKCINVATFLAGRAYSLKSSRMRLICARLTGISVCFLSLILSM